MDKPVDVVERVRLALVLASSGIERDVRLSELTDDEIAVLAKAAIAEVVRAMGVSDTMVDAGLQAYWPVSEFVEGPLTNGKRAERCFEAMLTAWARENEI